MSWQLGRKEDCAVAINVHYETDEERPAAMWIAADPATCLDFGWDTLDMMPLYRKAYPDEEGDDEDNEESGDEEGSATAGLLVPSDTEAGLYTVVARFKRGSVAKLRVRVFDPIDTSSALRTANGGVTTVEIPDASEATVHLHPSFRHERGAVHTLTAVHSPQLDNDRDILVYLPPSHAENTAAVYDKVLIQWDGQVLNDVMFTSTLDVAILCGDIDEVVVVGIPSIDDVRLNELTPTESSGDGMGDNTGKGDLLIDYVLDTVLPLVMASFPRVQPAKGTLGVGGYSLGGLMSAHALFTRRDDFNRGNLSSSSFCKPCAVLCLDLEESLDGLSLGVCVLALLALASVTLAVDVACGRVG